MSSPPHHSRAPTPPSTPEEFLALETVMAVIFPNSGPRPAEQYKSYAPLRRSVREGELRRIRRALDLRPYHLSAYDVQRLRDGVETRRQFLLALQAAEQMEDRLVELKCIGPEVARLTIAEKIILARTTRTRQGLRDEMTVWGRFLEDLLHQDRVLARDMLGEGEFCMSQLHISDFAVCQRKQVYNMARGMGRENDLFAHGTHKMEPALRPAKDLRYEPEEVKKLEKEKRRWLWAMLKAYDQIECKLAGVDDPDLV
ncbi:hypothetical protein EV122DRAFT_270727 [Schizophyllum commune]